MDIFSLRRPLYVFALVFFFGTLVLLWRGEQYGIWIAVVCALALLVVLCVPVLRRVSVLCVTVCALLVSSVLVYTRYQLLVQPLEKLNDTSAALTVRVESLPEENSKLYRTSVVNSDVLPTGTRLSMSFANPEIVPAQYDTVAGVASLYLPSAEQSYLHGEDIFLLGYFGDEVTVSAGKVKWYERLAAALRGKMVTGIYAALPGVEGDLVAGVCLGETTSLPAYVEEDFRKSGLSHLLVVSGLHMTVLAGAVNSLLRLLKVRRGIALFITLALLWVFMLMVGFSASVIRAAIMLHFVLIGQTLRLRADSRTSLATALLLIVLQSPYAVQDVGFLLSFAATLGLVVLTPVFHNVCRSSVFISTHPPVRKLLLAFCTPLAAMAFTAPILAYAFGTMSVLSPLANVLTAWPTTVLLCLGMAGAVTYCIPVISLLSKGFLFFAGLLSKWVLWIAAIIGDISAAQLQIRHSIIVLLLVLIPLAACYGFKLLGMRGLRRTLSAGVAVLVACVCVLTVFSRKTVSVRIDAQDSTLAVLVETGGHAMAVISAENHDACVSARYFLTACGVDKLDILVVTDGDTSITASLAQLLEKIPADTVIYPAGDIDPTAGISGIRREAVEDAAAFTFWKDMTIAEQNGWWRLTAGDTRVLLAPAGGDVNMLPVGWRQTHLCVFRGAVPKTVSLLETQRAVMLCAPQDVRYITGNLPWGSYPIHLTATEGALDFCITERGELAAADRYYL